MSGLIVFIDKRKMKDSHKKTCRSQYWCFSAIMALTNCVIINFYKLGSLGKLLAKKMAFQPIDYF